MIFTFLLLLKPALRVVEGGSRHPFDVLCALLALPIDILIAHTTWTLVAGFPRTGERTISDTLERLCKDAEHPRYALFVAMAKEINQLSPTGQHIKAVKE